MNWLKTIFSNSVSDRHETNSNSAKTFNNKYKGIGAFEYDHDGFTISYEDFTKRINWDDISQINVYKVDEMTIDRIDMEIVYSDNCFKINEELPGWYQFVLKTKEVFPSIPKDWDITIVKPAFGTNYRTIYDKTEGPV